MFMRFFECYRVAYLRSGRVLGASSGHLAVLMSRHVARKYEIVWEKVMLNGKCVLGSVARSEQTRQFTRARLRRLTTQRFCCCFASYL
jgi:hypothetical protein